MAQPRPASTHTATTEPSRDTVAARAGQPLRMLRRTLGAAALLGIVACSFLLAASASAGPSDYVRVHEAFWRTWIAGPFAGIGLTLTHSSFQALTLAMLACYLVVLLSGRTLPALAIAAAIVIAHVALLLGPPLLSKDVFGYVNYARMGALHGLNPYAHVPAQAAGDPSFAYIGWPFQHTPYGPLFTLTSYAFAPLGLAGALWSFKTLAVLTSLGAIALVALAAAREGRSGAMAAAFFGLNPVLLELTVGGAHNDTITLLLMGAALAVSAGVTQRARLRTAAWPLAIAAGFKISAGLLLPFLVLAGRTARERLRVLASAVGGLILVVAIGMIGFGGGIAGFLAPISEEQRQVAVHSIPAETGRLIGLGGAPVWWRYIFVAAFVCVLAWAMIKTARGTDWRVAAGWSTLALVISTAWLLPWYAVWALPLAAVVDDRRLRIATIAFCVYALAIRLPLAAPVLGHGV